MSSTTSPMISNKTEEDVLDEEDIGLLTQDLAQKKQCIINRIAVRADMEDCIDDKDSGGRGGSLRVTGLVTKKLGSTGKPFGGGG